MERLVKTLWSEKESVVGCWYRADDSAGRRQAWGARATSLTSAHSLLQWWCSKQYNENDIRLVMGCCCVCWVTDVGHVVMMMMIVPSEECAATNMVSPHGQRLATASHSQSMSTLLTLHAWSPADTAWFSYGYFELQRSLCLTEEYYCSRYKGIYSPHEATPHYPTPCCAFRLISDTYIYIYIYIYCVPSALISSLMASCITWWHDIKIINVSLPVDCL